MGAFSGELIEEPDGRGTKIIGSYNLHRSYHAVFTGWLMMGIIMFVFAALPLAVLFKITVGVTWISVGIIAASLLLRRIFDAIAGAEKEAIVAFIKDTAQATDMSSPV